MIIQSARKASQQHRLIKPCSRHETIHSHRCWHTPTNATRAPRLPPTKEITGVRPSGARPFASNEEIEIKIGKYTFAYIPIQETMTTNSK